MIRRLRYITLLFVLFAAANGYAQSYLRVGGEFDPMLCFTSIGSLGDFKDASASNREPLNFKGGLKVYYETGNLVGIALGTELSRKRFGFLHEEDIDGGGISLLGHGELFGLYFPAEAYLTLVSSKEPYFELGPYAGIAIGWDYSSYRNLTRQDNNYAYTYDFERHDYEKTSLGTNAYVGLNIRTIINDLGFIEWGLSAGMDIGTFPSFDYSITYDGSTTSYSESLRMIYFSFHLSYCFLNYEIFDGRFLRRRLN